MRTARPVGLTADGSALIVVTDSGENISVPADERLRAAIRDDRPRLGQLEIDMEPTLRPREIQQRIRAGESLADVAAAAGVPAERIEGFAAPVIAEREHVASLAADHPVRRVGDSPSAHRSLRTIVTDRLLSRGVDPDTLTWDSWRNPDRLWSVQLGYESGSAHREAVFHYDMAGRFSVAANDDARWLLNEQTASHGPQPGRRRRENSPDEEPTLNLDDEMALVRAIQPDEDAGETEDAYAEAELAEVDGVYDIVQPEGSNLDVLYDMLASFDEDSVKIYAGLIGPADSAPPAPPVVADEPEQLSLLDDAAPAAPSEPTEAPKPKSKRRAHVPSWDEIMFGGPKEGKPGSAKPKKPGPSA